MIFEIGKHLVLSTAHVTEEDAQLLPKCKLWTVLDYSYGFFLPVPSLGEPDQLEEILSTSDLPRSVHGLIRIAYIQDCTWLQLDADGPVVDMLPKYD